MNEPAIPHSNCSSLAFFSITIVPPQQRQTENTQQNWKKVVYFFPILLRAWGAPHKHEHQQDPTTQIPSLPTTTPDPSPTQTTTKFPKCGTQIKITFLPKKHLLSPLPRDSRSIPDEKPPCARSPHPNPVRVELTSVRAERASTTTARSTPANCSPPPHRASFEKILRATCRWWRRRTSMSETPHFRIERRHVVRRYA